MNNQANAKIGEESYKILRYTARGDRRPKTIRTGLTLEQAQEWCSREDTRKAGQWFDGYTKET